MFLWLAVEILIVSFAGLHGDRHSATLSMGQPGVLHGVRTYILQSKTGQIVETHSISAGLDYPGVGPEHAWLKDSNRAEYVVATDEEALRGFRMLTQREGIIPGAFYLLSFYLFERISTDLYPLALESSHAIWEAVKLAKTLPKGQDIVVVRLFILPLTSCYINQCIHSACLAVVIKMSSKSPSYCPSGQQLSTGTYLPVLASKNLSMYQNDVIIPDRQITDFKKSQCTYRPAHDNNLISR